MVQSFLVLLICQACGEAIHRLTGLPLSGPITGMVILLAVMILYDNFARHDHSGWAKAAWTILVLFLPFIGVLIYMIARPSTADRDFSGGGV